VAIASTTTNLGLLHDYDGYAYCENTYLATVTETEVPKGCVLFSASGFSDLKHQKAIFPTKTICMNSIGEFGGKLDLNYESLKAFNLVEEDKNSPTKVGKSILSLIVPGQAVEVTVFSGKNFDGESAVIGTTERGVLITTSYDSGISVNDNIYSMKIKSKAGGYFAGRGCGVATQVCKGTILAQELTADQPNGCILFSNSGDGPWGKHVDAVRICTTRFAVGPILATKRTLDAAGLAYRAGSSKLSYINKGKEVDLSYYSGTKFDGKEGDVTGDLLNAGYSSGDNSNDDIKSFTISSTAWKTPSTCQLAKIQSPEVASNKKID